ncbi:glycerate kinase [Cumulibacter soli]|uniref:glycerate kinase family protein n=1 Tax=Cumulibacter soli TaxID=2546344 RepID=UPI001068ACF2|nr:glycerate kinase [Cumulibacter soli]
MRIVIATDSFGQTLTAAEASAAITAGLQRRLGEISTKVEVIALPMSDGGPGFIESLRAGLAETSARTIDVVTTGPHGEQVRGQVLIASGGAAYVESAQAAGLEATERREPLWASSYGVGALLLAAVEAGAHTITVGLGGSATNDGGAGLLAAIGVVAFDEDGVALQPGALPLLGVDHLSGTPALRTASIVAATDVDNPLTGPEGASAVFGPQKGASPQDVRVLDAALSRWGEVLQRDRPAPAGLANLPGAGAAGGMGAALYALRARRRSGFEVVAEALGLADAVASADLVITGEGSFDEQSVRGKVTGSVADLARSAGRPCVVLAGRSSLGRRQASAYGVDETYALVDAVGEQRAMEAADVVLQDVAYRTARHWVR